MTTYKYEGISESGAKIEGIVEAFDEQDAVAKARENCRQLLHVELVRNGKLHKLMNLDIGDVLSGGKVKPKSLSLLCSQLAIELKAGLPLVSSLRLVAENEQDKKMKQVLEDVAADVHAGNSLADSFASRAKGFPNSFIETVRAGEESGRLDESFERLKKYYEDSANVSSKVKSAMVYPIMLIAVAVVVIFVIMVFAVPVFEDSFSNMGTAMPLPTRMLISMSNFMTQHALLLICIIAIIVLAIVLFHRTEKGKRFHALAMLKIPGIKLVTQMKAATQFSSTLGTMMASGLPMVKSVKITAATMDNLLVAEDVLAASNGVMEGNRLCEGLRKSQWLPSLLLEMTSVGEETGKLEDTLYIVSDYYTKEVNTAVGRALEILNPVITICLAIIVVFILLSVYLPIFSMYGSM